MKTRIRYDMPPVSPVDPGIVPAVVEERLDNEIPLYLLNAGTEDILRLEFIFDAGNAFENIPLLAAATNEMLAEGTRKLTASSINKMLDYHGAFYNLYADKDTGGLVIFVLTRHLRKILEIVKEMLFYPAFPAHELKAMLKKRLQLFLISREKVNNLASDGFFEAAFGPGHPYGRQITAGDFSNIRPGMLRDFHRKQYATSSCTIIVSGNTNGKVLSIINRIFGSMNVSGTAAGFKCHPPEKRTAIRNHITKQGAVQSSVRIGGSTINKLDPDYPGLKITDMILGGYFGSRLMKNIREEKGYTYGIHSYVSSLSLAGFKVISTEVNKKNTGKTIDEIIREIRLLQSVPVGNEELGIVRNYMMGELARMFDGPFAIAESFRAVWQFGLDNSYYYRLSEKIKTIQPDEIMQLAGTYYNTDELNIITAG